MTANEPCLTMKHNVQPAFKEILNLLYHVIAHTLAASMTCQIKEGYLENMLTTLKTAVFSTYGERKKHHHRCANVAGTA